MSTRLPPRIPVTRAQIEEVVARFYAAIRVHDRLGPVFIGILSRDAAIWQAHEAKIAAFWANAILHERNYDGNPMLVHSGISAIEPDMFTDWLSLFDRVLAELLPKDTALQWSALAHRIGRGLRMGIEMQQSRTEGPPLLR